MAVIFCLQYNVQWTCSHSNSSQNVYVEIAHIACAFKGKVHRSAIRAVERAHLSHSIRYGSDVMYYVCGTCRCVTRCGCLSLTRRRRTVRIAMSHSHATTKLDGVRRSVPNGGRPLSMRAQHVRVGQNERESERERDTTPIKLQSIVPC